MNDIASRDRAIVSMAEAGLTYEEIGGTFGVTRERVRQILKKVGITGSTTRAARSAAQLEVLASDRERIIGWARHNPGLEARDAEAALNLKSGRVGAALGADANRVFVQAKRGVRVRYSDQVIFESLRCASTLQGDPMSKAAYDEYVEAVGGTTGVLVIRRFGYWKAACSAAGIAVNSERGNTHRRWGQGQLVEVMIGYLRSPEARGSYRDYCNWAAEAKDRSSKWPDDLEPVRLVDGRQARRTRGQCRRTRGQWRRAGSVRTNRRRIAGTR